MKPTWLSQVNDRGQVVLLAALLLVVALVPMVFAYLQLGYDGDVHTGIESDSVAETQRVLDRTVHNASTGVADSYNWDDRSEAVRTIQDRLDPTLQTLTASRLDERTAYELSYNGSRAQAWANANCPAGPNRQFGGCESINGVVVQERAERTHALAVAFDLTVTTPDGETSLTTVVPIWAG